MTSDDDIIDQSMLVQLQELLADRFRELVERFINDGNRRMEYLRNAIAVQDFDVVHAEAHGLKGSSRNIGANRLGELCNELEQKGRSKVEAELATIFAAVEQEFAAVCDTLKKFQP